MSHLHCHYTTYQTVKMKALIIEDEILASRHLKQLLAEEGDMDVIDTLESIAETIEWFGRNAQPDIVFMDIHLADGIAIEISIMLPSTAR